MEEDVCMKKKIRTPVFGWLLLMSLLMVSGVVRASGAEMDGVVVASSFMSDMEKIAAENSAPDKDGDSKPVEVTINVDNTNISEKETVIIGSPDQVLPSEPLSSTPPSAENPKFNFSELAGAVLIFLKNNRLPLTAGAVICAFAIISLVVIKRRQKPGKPSQPAYPYGLAENTNKATIEKTSASTDNPVFERTVGSGNERTDATVQPDGRDKTTKGTIDQTSASTESPVPERAESDGGRKADIAGEPTAKF
jgi:hypothetical protein